MVNILFARTRHDYTPYRDVYRLIELSGFPLVYIDEVDWQRDQVVIGTPKSPEWSVIPMLKRARLIWWTFERGLTDYELMDMSNPYIPPQVDDVWASDRALANEFGCKYVFLGGHPAFGSANVRDKQWDIISLMYLNGRRLPLARDLQGLSSADCKDGTWGDERHERLQRTRLMVRAHQDDQPWSEPIAWMLAACYALPMLAETCADPGYWVDGLHYESAPLGWMGQRARDLLKDEVKLARLGAAAWRLVCVERDFKSQVLEAVEA